MSKIAYLNSRIAYLNWIVFLLMCKCPYGYLFQPSVNIEECGQRCDSRSDCKGFVYEEGTESMSYRRCNLKSQMCSQPGAAVNGISYYTSYYKQGIHRLSIIMLFLLSLLHTNHTILLKAIHFNTMYYSLLHQQSRV